MWAMLTDQAFHEEVCKATGATSWTAEVVPTADGGATITTRRTLPTDEFPDFVKSFVGSTIDVVRTDVWQAARADGNRSGTTVVEIKGAPVRLDGTMQPTTEGGTTVHDVDGRLKASIPLLGGKVEKAVEPPIRSAISREQQVGGRWLTR
ncbi:hypothetical protein GCM10025868_12400 [Angustibacter aerolatus]|uniref:DUF2505 domain-containing protein n=1 Tax=Angustibacter aerolatus TaxID=1162965 RepID=A0ABQ6JGM2_9ACTN|nr:hypothetical protein GCM10025868_12400 [Angustibacter aerolatus]